MEIMESIGAVLLKENINVAANEEKALQAMDAEGFSALLGMMLGLTNMPENKLAQTTLTGESANIYQNTNSKNIPNIDVLFANIKSTNDGLTPEIPLLNQFKTEELEESGKSPQLYQGNVEKLAFISEEQAGLEVIAEKAELVEKANKLLKESELSPNQEVENQDTEEFITVAKFANMAKNSTGDSQSLFGKIAGEVVELEKTKSSSDGMGEQIKDVITDEEIATKGFRMPITNQTEDIPKEINSKVENLAKDLPEIVTTKLKTFENKDGSKDIVIHLEPKELGKLVVKLTSQEGIVSVKFMANYPVTRDLLESSINNLRQSFTEQGISFDRLDVELGGQQLNQSQYQQQNQQSTWFRGNFYSGDEGRTDLEGLYENSIMDAEPHALLKTGTYDYRV